MDGELQLLRQLFTKQVGVETDVDPDDDKTPGWTAMVYLEDHFRAVWMPTPAEAVHRLFEILIEEKVIYADE